MWSLQAQHCIFSNFHMWNAHIEHDNHLILANIIKKVHGQNLGKWKIAIWFYFWNFWFLILFGFFKGLASNTKANCDIEKCSLFGNGAKYLITTIEVLIFYNLKCNVYHRVLMVSSTRSWVSSTEFRSSVSI